MIEDKKHRAKIAESPEEALWYQVVQARKQTIDQYKKNILIEEVFLKAAEHELKRIQRNGK